MLNWLCLWLLEHECVHALNVYSLITECDTGTLTDSLKQRRAVWACVQVRVCLLCRQRCQKYTTVSRKSFCQYSSQVSSPPNPSLPGAHTQTCSLNFSWVSVWLAVSDTDCIQHWVICTQTQMHCAEDRDKTGSVSTCNGKSREKTKCQSGESRKQTSWTQERRASAGNWTVCLFVFQCGCDARYRDTVVEKQRGENNKQVVRKTCLDTATFCSISEIQS